MALCHKLSIDEPGNLENPDMAAMRHQSFNRILDYLKTDLALPAYCIFYIGQGLLCSPEESDISAIDGQHHHHKSWNKWTSLTNRTNLGFLLFSAKEMNNGFKLDIFMNSYSTQPKQYHSQYNSYLIIDSFIWMSVCWPVLVVLCEFVTFDGTGC